MARKSIEKIAQEIALPIVEELGYELVDLEYKKEGPHWCLRLYIDKPGGITLDDCQEVSQRVGDVLDIKDPIPHNYFLEVSSVGLDRPLKKEEDFVRFKGRNVDLKLYRAIDGSKNYTGELIGLDGDTIQIRVGGEILGFKRDQVAIVRLSVEF
ncbi:MAG: ribosome maturation factor RimP [Caldicoprobacterales bacterium]|nr:ribosome maturation factor RimP [Clostridiales bacterium]